MTINKNEMVIKRNEMIMVVGMKSVVNGTKLMGYGLIPMNMYNDKKEDIDSVSVRIDGIKLTDSVTDTKVIVAPMTLDAIFKMPGLLNNNELGLDILDSISDQADINLCILSKFNKFITDKVIEFNNGQSNRITLKENTTIEHLNIEIPAGTTIKFSVPMPEKLTFKMY